MAKSKKKASVKKPVKKPVKKKAAPKKKKTPAKKKAVKALPNPHVGKRHFMIGFGGRGGEFMAATASEEFVKYWQDEDRKDNLVDHIQAMHEMSLNCVEADQLDDMDEEEAEQYSGYDKNSPGVYGSNLIQEYWNLDDLEHDTMVDDAYTSYTLTEIKLNPMTVYKNGELGFDEKYSSKKNFDWGTEHYTVVDDTEREITIDKTLYSRELYMEDDKKDIETPVPALILFDSQKGEFGRLYIQTNGEDFDPNKLVKSLLETNTGTFVEKYYYDKQFLPVDTGWLSTWGKGFDAYVGYLHKWDVDYDYEANVKEGWENLEAK